MYAVIDLTLRCHKKSKTKKMHIHEEPKGSASSYIAPMKHSLQMWQSLSYAAHISPLAPALSCLASQALIPAAERQQQAITNRWECDTSHKSLSGEIAFLQPAWDSVWMWGKKTTAITHRWPGMSTRLKWGICWHTHTHTFIHICTNKQTHKLD